MWIWFFEMKYGHGTHVQIIIADTEDEARTYLDDKKTTWVVSEKHLNVSGHITTIIE